MPVSGPSLITGCPCALSQAECLGLLTVEKRMLWLECCGVNSGEHSSQCWVMAGVAQAAGQIKWLLCVTWLHTICFCINWLHPPGSGPKTHSMKSKRHTCSWGACLRSFSCYFGRFISSVEHGSLLRLSHIKAVYPRHSLLSGQGSKWEGRCFPKEVQNKHAEDLRYTVVFSSQHLIIISFWMCEPVSLTLE